MNSESALLTVLIQLVVIIGASRLFGAIFRNLGQPQVCGEIAAGLLLGPSLFGGMFPSLFKSIFDPSVSSIFNVMSQLGLVLMMFLIGLEFDFSHVKEHRRAALSISIAGIVIPFALGFALGEFMHPRLHLAGSAFTFSLFMAAAMSITAIPTLGRIMIEMNIQRTRIGSLTISAAAVGDAAGWIIVALITAIARSTFDPSKFGLMVAEVFAFALIMMFAVRPMIIHWSRRMQAKSAGTLTLDSLAILLIVIFLSGAATNLIGIFSIFGAFFLGAVLYDQIELVAAIRRRLSDFVTVFFLPIFFTYTGLRTDIGSMEGSELWMMCGLVLLAATAGKFGGCLIAARANGFPWRESSIMGVLMNTRGLMELIVINIGYDLGIIPKSVFFMLVLMAVITTYMTAPILRRLVAGSEIEKEYRASSLASTNRSL